MNPNTPAANAPANLETVYGKKPWQGVVGFLGGAALIALAAWLEMTFTLSGRGRGHILALGLAGVVFLIGSFRVYGIRLTPGGLFVWEYYYWIMGRTRTVVPEEIESVVLGNKKGKFTVSVRLRDGKEYPIPGNWVTLKDAQALIDLCTNLYGVSAGVAISDEKVLEEAALFAAAKRWRVRPFKRSRAEGERLMFANEQGENMGEVTIWKPFFRSPRAGIAGGPGDPAASGSRWLLQKRRPRFFSLGSRRVAVTEDEREARDVECGASFLEDKLFYQWTDAAGIYWSAVFKSESSEKRTPFTMHFYRGLAESVGKKARREQVRQSQGEPVLVALANGQAADFTVDVADEEAWPWVRIALACVWLCKRPAFTFAKQ